MKQHLKHYTIAVVAVLAILIVAGLAFVYSGLYNIGADAHHTRPVSALLETLRERSIHVRSDDIKVPDLKDPQRILEGAGHYAAMCTDCHLKPGAGDSEIRPGLYPQPPNLSQDRVEPKMAFWVIKHGIKMSAMPAWGKTHDDETIWNMVAFLQKLPDLTPQQYRDMVAKAPPDEDMEMSDGDGGHHSHGGGEASGHHHAQDGSTDRPADARAGSRDGYAPEAAPDAEVAARAFHSALQRGDRTAVLGLLTPDATIEEAGQTQSPKEYAAHHLGEDLAFLKRATVTPLWMGSMPMGDNAMVASESRILMTDRDKPIALRSTEKLTLRKLGPAWKISAVHWQSSPEEMQR